ncbi:MAG: hypothetical protein RLY86_3631 [Pseudomonadota bacterium]|jgi:C4-dicarboxylate-specific signal transduction histidine kinase
MRIVIIDDQKLNIAILEASLRGEPGLQIIGFDQPEAAVAWIKAERPDLVFVDYDMPGMDGLQVVAALRSDTNLDEMPVVMVSGVEMRDVRVLALKLGANDFLAKPVDPIELRARTANMLRLRRRSHDLRESNRCLEEARTRAETALAQLRSTQDQLVQSEKLAALGGLVAGVAHELNTPVGNALTSITWSGDSIDKLSGSLATGTLRKADLTDFLDQMEECTRLVRTNLERAARIVQAFKQIAADSATDQPRRFALADHLEDLQIAMAPDLTRANVRLEVTCPGDLNLTAAPGALTRVLAQLIHNAMTHAWGGGRPGILHITAAADADGTVRLDIADDGDGMAEEVRSRLFEPFFTTARAKGGIGLGLATVHNLVRRALGGEIGVETAPGAGTRFRLTLPPAGNGAAALPPVDLGQRPVPQDPPLAEPLSNV